jgi:TPR repeat protein
MAATMSAGDRVVGEVAVKKLERTRQSAGAFYRDDDPLFAPDFAEMERNVAKYGDPEEELRLAYHEEADVGGPAGFAKAMDLYRAVRDQRVGSVRLRIGNEYLLGTNGFPRNAERAAKWYGFAAQAGSKEACTQLSEMNRPGC